MPKLRPEVKEEWVRRLRSGEYKQGGTFLHRSLPGTGQHYWCCWGVLEQMFLESQGKEWSPVEDRDDGVMEANAGAGSTGIYMPEEGCIAWAGLTEEDLQKLYEVGGIRESLSGLNDNFVPFPVIADLIEEQL